MWIEYVMRTWMIPIVIVIYIDMILYVYIYLYRYKYSIIQMQGRTYLLKEETSYFCSVELIVNCSGSYNASLWFFLGSGRFGFNGIRFQHKWAIPLSPCLYMHEGEDFPFPKSYRCYFWFNFMPTCSTVPEVMSLILIHYHKYFKYMIFWLSVAAKCFHLMLTIRFNKFCYYVHWTRIMPFSPIVNQYSLYDLTWYVRSLVIRFY